MKPAVSAVFCAAGTMAAAPRRATETAAGLAFLRQPEAWPAVAPDGHHYNNAHAAYIMEGFLDKPSTDTGFYKCRLDVSNCGLTALPDELGLVEDLRDLVCGGNNLTTLPATLGACRELERIVCNDNDLASLPEGLELLPRLESLYCQNNQLTGLPASLGRCPLKYLVCHNNPFEEPWPSLLTEVEVSGPGNQLPILQHLRKQVGKTLST